MNHVQAIIPTRVAAFVKAVILTGILATVLLATPAQAASFPVVLPDGATLASVQPLPGLHVTSNTYQNHTGYLVSVTDAGLVGYTVRFQDGRNATLFGEAVQNANAASVASLAFAVSALRNETTRQTATTAGQQAIQAMQVANLTGRVALLTTHVAALRPEVASASLRIANGTNEVLGAVAGLSAQAEEMSQVMPAMRQMTKDSDQLRTQVAMVKATASDQNNLILALAGLQAATLLAIVVLARLWANARKVPPQALAETNAPDPEARPTGPGAGLKAVAANPIKAIARQVRRRRAAFADQEQQVLDEEAEAKKEADKAALQVQLHPGEPDRKRDAVPDKAVRLAKRRPKRPQADPEDAKLVDEPLLTNGHQDHGRFPGSRLGEAGAGA